jgi:hypothetical protein
VREGNPFISDDLVIRECERALPVETFAHFLSTGCIDIRRSAEGGGGKNLMRKPNLISGVEFNGSRQDDFDILKIGS